MRLSLLDITIHAHFRCQKLFQSFHIVWVFSGELQSDLIIGECYNELKIRVERFCSKNNNLLFGHNAGIWRLFCTYHLIELKVLHDGWSRKMWDVPSSLSAALVNSSHVDRYMLEFSTISQYFHKARISLKKPSLSLCLVDDDHTWNWGVGEFLHIFLIWIGKIYRKTGHSQTTTTLTRFWKKKTKRLGKYSKIKHFHAFFHNVRTLDSKMAKFERK